MKIKLEKQIVQLHVRHKIEGELEDCLPEAIFAHCYISEDDAWNFKYKYNSIIEFTDEIVCIGSVVAKAKKKFDKLIKEKEHNYTFGVRIKGKYDFEVVTQKLNKENF